MPLQHRRILHRLRRLLHRSCLCSSTRPRRHHHRSRIHLRNPKMPAQMQQIQRPQRAVHHNCAHIPIPARQHHHAVHIRALKAQPQVRRRRPAMPVRIHQVLVARRAISLIDRRKRARIVARIIAIVKVVNRNAVQPRRNLPPIRILPVEKSIRSRQHRPVQRKAALRRRLMHHRLKRKRRRRPNLLRTGTPTGQQGRPKHRLANQTRSAQITPHPHRIRYPQP